jgi:hypothetical protein
MLVGKTTFILLLGKQWVVIFSVSCLCFISNFLDEQEVRHFAPWLGINTELQLGQFFTNFRFFSSQKYI